MCSDSTGGFSFWICLPVYLVSGMATDSIFFFLCFKKNMKSIGLYHRFRNHAQVFLSTFRPVQIDTFICEKVNLNIFSDPTRS